ncbi:hypothetical protein XBO1_600032 [Xenorhabdus bovienii str. oregonense]|uniref:Uncharacterized protein n=1 Tax=Xenorhabdus bovienii str. oregonense TaxID=1398202 RepID=A0A077P9R0_XENBV|nr:hypothetical protein XBO1_600032 [Xenorhabdus bovienii str. oregonense]
MNIAIYMAIFKKEITFSNTELDPLLEDAQFFKVYQIAWRYNAIAITTYPSP